MEQRAEEITAMGITHILLPPAYKGALGAESVGYDTYDLFDLGEFDRKGSVATKYGDRVSFERACSALSNRGISVIHVTPSGSIFPQTAAVPREGSIPTSSSICAVTMRRICWW